MVVACLAPRPRNYSFKLNKKVKDLARRSALTFKAQNNQILVVEDLKFDAPKTKDFVNITKNLNIADKKIVLVLDSKNENVYLSARNVENVYVISAADLNTYRVLDNKALVMTESSVAIINEF